MPPINQHALIDLLDGNLGDEEKKAMLSLIDSDPGVREEWGYIQYAVKAIRLASLTKQVAEIKDEYHSGAPVHHISQKPSLVRNFGSVAWKAAACIVVLLFSATLLKYFITTPQDLYNKYYSSYDINISRGNAKVDALEQNYKNKDWKAVVAAFDKAQIKDNKSLFFAAVAQMELKNFSAAINSFNTIIQNNRLKNDTYFQDEAQYYLALCYVAVNKTRAANLIFQEIKSDTSHLYYKKVSRMSFIEEQILKNKGGQ